MPLILNQLQQSNFDLHALTSDHPNEADDDDGDESDEFAGGDDALNLCGPLHVQTVDAREECCNGKCIGQLKTGTILLNVHRSEVAY